MKFPRMGGRAFIDFRHSSAREIDDKLIRSAWQNILGARSDTERNLFFDRCMHAYMDACDIFKDYTVLNYETGEVIHYDPPEADARLAHEDRGIPRPAHARRGLQRCRRRGAALPAGQALPPGRRVTATSVAAHA